MDESMENPASRLAGGVLALFLLAGCGLAGGPKVEREVSTPREAQPAAPAAGRISGAGSGSEADAALKTETPGGAASRRRATGGVAIRYVVGPDGTIDFSVDGREVVAAMPGEDALTQGETRFRQWAAKAGHPFLAANLLEEGSGNKRPGFVAPYRIVEVGSLRLAVIGLLAPQVDLSADARLLDGLRSPYAGLTITDPLAAARQTVKEAAMAADLVVVLSSLGPAADRRLVLRVPGIDLVLGRNRTPGVGPRQNGDRFLEDAKPSRGAPVLEQIRNSYLMWAGDGKPSLAEVELFVGENGVDKIQGKYPPAPPKTPEPFQALQELQTPGIPQTPRTPQTPRIPRDQAERPVHEKIGEATVDMNFEPPQIPGGETVIGNFVADALRSWTRADIAMLQAGEIRAGLNKGAITPLDLQRVVPGAEEVAVAEVRGAVVKELLERGVVGYSQSFMISGMNVHFDFHRGAGNRVMAVEIGGRLLDPLAYYRIAAARSLLARSERAGEPVRYLIRYHQSLAQLLKEWIAARGRVSAALDGRIRAGSYTVIDVVATGGLYGSLGVQKHPSPGGTALGGLALLGGNIREIQAQNPRGAILVDTGDLLAGEAENDLFQGEAMVEALNTLGFTATAVGEHDLEWGEAVLGKREARARFSFLAANAYERSSGLPVKWAEPAKMITVAGRKIGLVGVTLPSGPEALRPEIRASTEFRAVVPAVNAEAAKLRKAGMEIVVVLAHVPGKIEELARGFQGVDLVVAAPSGKATSSGYIPSTGDAGAGKKAPVMVPGQGGSSVARARLLWDKEAGKVSWHGVQLVEVAPGRTDPDAALLDLTERYALRARVRLAQIIGTAVAPLKRNPDGESSLGNVVTDAYREATGAEIALQPGEELRGDLPAGPVTRGDLLSILPGREHLIIIELSGDGLKRAVDQIARTRRALPQVSGLEIVVEGTGEAGKGRRIVEVRPGEKLPAAGGTFRVAVPAALARDHRVQAFSEARHRTDSFVNTTDAVLTWFESHKKADGKVEGRIRQKQAEASGGEGLDSPGKKG
ncbi:MAG: 5'-nucleotidase C-terminal domain-containing protein [Firmicutes bacterium]|nr:5'-nucleotidase C-terminal domain-containing protein [Bacillota bacterium]